MKHAHLILFSILFGVLWVPFGIILGITLAWLLIFQPAAAVGLLLGTVVTVWWWRI